MKINRNYKSKNPVQSSDFPQSLSGETEALAKGQYNDDRDELNALWKKYDLQQESDRELRKFEEEQHESEQKILQQIRELREKAYDTQEINELEEMEAAFLHMEKRRQDIMEERRLQKKILMGKIEEKEALCRKYEAERGSKEWG